MNYCEWDIKYPTTETNKEFEVLTVAHHKKILDFIKQNFTFVSVSAMLVYTRQKNIAQVFILERYFFVSICPAANPGTYLMVFLVVALLLCLLHQTYIQRS